MSRLEEECIMYIGRNRSGIDAGEIDYGIMSEKFDRLTIDDLNEAMKCLKKLAQKMAERFIELTEVPDADKRG